MMPVNAPGAAPVSRRRELDFLRGLALIVMTIGHPLRANVYGEDVTVDPLRLLYNHYGELFSALFMFASGINVQNFLASAARHPNLNATRFYLKSSVALFALGWTYNLCVGTSLFIDIIQAIAIGTLVTYIFLRMRAPTWLMTLYVLFVFFAALAIVGPGPITDATMERVRPIRYFIAFFGPIPWTGFFIYGVIVDRTSRAASGRRRWMIAGALLFAFAHLLPPLRGTTPAVFLLKANARYLVMAAGLLPLLLTIGETFYRGESKAGRAIEYWGQESLVFLVVHWVYIFYIGIALSVAVPNIGDNPAAWITGLATFALMTVSVRPIAAWRDAWAKRAGFLKWALAAFVFAMWGWSTMMARLGKLAFQAGQLITQIDLTLSATPTYLTFFAKQNFAFLAALTFCFIYPSLRARFRRTSTRRP
ncbi:DUF1624 domain-containing protein [bacterium]|nr:DUF1624 domain-containing protein [bacterium]